MDPRALPTGVAALRLCGRLQSLDRLVRHGCDWNRPGDFHLDGGKSAHPVCVEHLHERPRSAEWNDSGWVSTSVKASVYGACGLGAAKANPVRGHPSWFFVSVASKGLSDCVSGLESTLAGCLISVDSKGTYVAPKLCKTGSRALFLISVQ